MEKRQATTSNLMPSFPDFLVIGAQKAGTTWLFQNLRMHPQVWLPPEKEIHFFDFPPPHPFLWLFPISWGNY